MAGAHHDPHDDKVASVPLPTDDGDEVVLQENMSPEVGLGGGEWPPTGSPPRGPAPGTAEGGDSERGRTAPAGDDEDEAFPPMKEVLHVDPVSGGSQSVTEQGPP